MECKHDDLLGFTLHGGSNSARCKCGKTFIVGAADKEKIQEAQAAHSNVVRLSERQIAKQLNNREPIANIELMLDKRSQQMRGVSAFAT